MQGQSQRKAIAGAFLCVIAVLLWPAREAAPSPNILLAQVQKYDPTKPVPGPQETPPVAARGKTAFVEFENAPFPFDDDYVNPRTGRSFAAGTGSTRRGRAAAADTFNDARVLLHIPKGFDVRKPALIVIFFHGHRATIDRDVLARQRVAEQISRSGANAALVAPQFAVNASDSSAGTFWEPGLFDAFLNEAAEQLAIMHGDLGLTRNFDRMNVLIVGYSGGFSPVAWAIHHGTANKRLRGVVLLDALYGELDKFEQWIAGDRSRFFVSGYLGSTRNRNLQLQRTLTDRNIPFRMGLDGDIRPGSVTFIAGAGGERHHDYVTKAWTQYPIADLLNRMPGYRR